MLNYKIGIDLDNTIISYDRIFFKLALKKKLIPKDFSHKREKIRNFIKSRKGIDQWKKLQSDVYSNYLKEAKPQKGFVIFLKLLNKKKINYCIISHKTKYPYYGKKINLHKLSREWLNKNVFKKKTSKNYFKGVFFETTENKKIERINIEKCDYFIDDLPSILNKLPCKIKKILIDPGNANSNNYNYLKFKRWKEIFRVFS